MPVFEYECQNCGYIHEVLSRPNEPAPQRCPKCSKPALERKFSVFSGSGGRPDSCLPESG